MLRLGPAAALCALALMVAAVPAAAATAPAGGQARAMLVFLPQTEPEPLPANPTKADEDAAKARAKAVDTLNRLKKRPSLSLGLLGATQGRYTQFQALLDISQGTRVSYATYKPQDPPDLRFTRAGTGAYFRGWTLNVSRADSAPADILPGLMAASVPGGAGYAGVDGRFQREALAAANRHGHVAEVSIGPSDTIAARAQALLAGRRFVVVGLPTGDKGGHALDQLIAARQPGELLLVMRTPPERRAPQLLPTGMAVDGKPGGLTSETTRQPGLIAGIDVLPTVLEHLGLPVPKQAKGEPIRSEGKRDPDALNAFDDRSRVVGPRRLPALETALVAWVAVMLLLGAIDPREGIRRGMRIGALGCFWIPSMLLVTAALHPHRPVELAVIAGGALILSALTDRFVPWPRGPAVPAGVGLVAYAVDLAFGSPLIVRSLLGPNPRFGSRYYGIGNELEAILPILLLVGLAAAYPALRRSRHAVVLFAVAGAVLGVIIGSARLGADVGGVITVGAATAAAVLVLLPGGPTRRAIVIAVFVPLGALVALALIDLATGGNGHFTRSVLKAGSWSDVWDTVRRRYDLAYKNLVKALTPVLTAMALLAIAYAVRNRATLYATVRGREVWHAVLIGGLASSVVGALFNDSGPILLLYGIVVLAFTTMYLRAEPRPVARGPAADGEAGYVAPARRRPAPEPEPVGGRE
jgi:hypothetical protein